MAKMYIVGDPKQSIYSFQNADIESYIAAKEIIAKLGGAVYCLIDNYRSLPEMVNGYNAILCRRDHHIQARESESGGDWFLFGDGGSKISYPSTGSGGELARAPERGAPLHPLPYKAVQIIPMEGYKPEDRQRVAQAACHAIEKLKGMTISVPDGAGWEELTLDYDDFAVIVETHALADPYIEEFRKSKIPFVKYKMWGVFNSAMARDLAALLAAIHKRHSAAPRTAALLTRFFNRPPETVSSAEIFEPCPNSCCAGDDLCLAHALDHWGPLAEKQLWAQLFRDIVERTGIRQRLIRLADGERNLADLRQVVDYCVEFLYQENSNIERLIDRLKRLYNEEAQAGQDKNTHMLSTEKPSVTILTMHASKGLEFPIVFIMNSDSKKLPKGPNILSWTDDDGCCGVRRFAPYLSIAKSKKTDAASERERLGKPIELYTQDQNRERRRLLYVAMTRPKAMLFAPMRESEKDLSPRLKELLDSGDQNIALFDEQLFRRDSGQSGKPETGAPQSIRLDDIPKLSLKEFIAEETSYTQLSRKASYFNDESKDDEDYAEDAEIAGNAEDIYPENKSPKQPLKGGRLTGDALHKALEEILRADDINTIISDGDQLDKITEKHLKCGVISDDMDTDERQKAVGQASSYIRDALRAPFPLEHGGTAVIADLPKSDRVPEMEFLFPQKPHRVRGFMDLVFRVRNDRHKAHPYRYYFIDWKSDSLKSFDPESVGRYCREKNYTLQARIYARALDKYLNGILGARYSPEENLGEALYVFLRGGAARHSENLKNFAFDDGHMYIL
jgi:exodeoxyribonuclease V beta subunit